MRIHKLICWIAVTGCAATPDDGRHLRTRDSAGVRITENISSADAAAWQISSSPVVELGADDPGGILYGVRGAVRLSNGEYVVANGGYDELRWYDAAGRFVRQAGREGRGPGEFISLSWIGRQQGDTVITWDSRSRHVSVFTGDGAFVSTVPAPFRGAVRGRFADGSLLLGQARNSGEGFGRSQTTLWQLFPKSGRADSVGSHPGEEQIMTRRATGSGFRFATQSPPFGRDGAFAVRGQHILVSSQNDYEFREYATDGSLVKIMR